MLNSFPFLKQRDSMHCGITCLQMICRYFGKDHISIYLRKRSFCTNEGISLFAITQIANEIGLKSLSLKTSIGALENSKLPCILHWNQKHFVVLYKVKNNKMFYVEVWE